MIQKRGKIDKQEEYGPPIIPPHASRQTSKHSRPVREERSHQNKRNRSVHNESLVCFQEVAASRELITDGERAKIGMVSSETISNGEAENFST